VGTLAIQIKTEICPCILLMIALIFVMLRLTP
jgi:hypothetical protein